MKKLLIFLMTFILLLIISCASSKAQSTEHSFTNEEIVIGKGTEYELAGLLSIPAGASSRRQSPAVVLVHGSGPQDIDSTIFANKPFRDIAYYLASNGIAVIRYDKRTFTHGAKMLEEFGGSLTVYEETIEDAILATEILKSDPRIDKNRIFIIGHSLGAMLAPRIHIESGSVYAGLILLAGSPRFLLDISYDQNIALIEKTLEGDEREAMLAIFAENWDLQIAALMNLPDDEAKRTIIQDNVSAYYFKDLYVHPISEYIKKVTVPFLVLQGSSDFHVYPDKDFALYKELLNRRSNVTFKLYEGLNHLFMPSTIGDITRFSEEYSIPSHVDAQVLADIVGWIKAQAPAAF